MLKKWTKSSIGRTGGFWIAILAHRKRKCDFICKFKCLWCKFSPHPIMQWGESERAHMDMKGEHQVFIGQSWITNSPQSIYITSVTFISKDSAGVFMCSATCEKITLLNGFFIYTWELLTPWIWRSERHYWQTPIYTTSTVPCTSNAYGRFFVAANQQGFDWNHFT